MKIIGFISLVFFSYSGFGQIVGLRLNDQFKLTAVPKSLFQMERTLEYPYIINKSNPVHLNSNHLSSFQNLFRYKDDLGFFCKIELKWDKKLAKPFRFRLGSYDYVNHMEGK